MNAIEFSNSVLNSFKKYFPNGHAHASKYALGGGVHFNFGLIGDINDVSSKIRGNDQLRLSFGIHDNFVYGTTHGIEGKLVVEGNLSSVSVLPTVQYMAMGSVKIPFRKINNTPDKVLNSIDKYFSKARDIVREQISLGKVYGQDNILSKYLDI